RALWHVVLRFGCSLRSFGKDVKNIKINAPDSVRLRRATLSGELGSETKNSIALETTGALESALITASRSGLRSTNVELMKIFIGWSHVSGRRYQINTL